MYQRTERELARDIHDSDPAKAGLARMLRDGLRTWRKAYDDIPLAETKEESGKPQRTKETKETPRPLNLKEIVATCADRYIGLGRHMVVYPDLSEGEAIERYRADFTVPKDARMPKEYKVRFPVVNAVDPRIPIPEKDRRAGIKEWINTGNIENQTFIPDKPYVVFTHNGTLYLPNTVNQAMGRFKENEVGEPLTETIDLYLNRPDFFRTRGRDSAGSRTEDGTVPFLHTFGGGPEVDADSPDDPTRRYGAGSRGKKIIELGS